MPSPQQQLSELKKALQAKARPDKALVLKRFLKTGPGEYGEHDIFLGVVVPELRKLAKRFSTLGDAYIQNLLHSSIHEERFVALIILINRFKRGPDQERRRCARIYLRHLPQVNNWDLVDVSAHAILGPILAGKKKNLLFNLARDKNLWKRRIAIITTLYFIRQNHFETTLGIAQRLLHDPEDLIHKAVGWMLREIGKRDLACAETFIQKNLSQMPRTMLRYALECFPAKKRNHYLHFPVTSITH